MDIKPRKYFGRYGGIDSKENAVFTVFGVSGRSSVDWTHSQGRELELLRYRESTGPVGNLKVVSKVKI